MAFYTALVCGWYAFRYTSARLSWYPEGCEVMHFTLRLWLTFGVTFLIGAAVYAFAFGVGLPEWWAAEVGAFIGYFAFGRVANHLIPLPDDDDHIAGRRPPVSVPFGPAYQRALLSLFPRPAPPPAAPTSSKGDPSDGPSSEP